MVLALPLLDVGKVLEHLVAEVAVEREAERRDDQDEVLEEVQVLDGVILDIVELQAQEVRSVDVRLCKELRRLDLLVVSADDDLVVAAYDLVVQLDILHLDAYFAVHVVLLGGKLQVADVRVGQFACL